MVTKKQDVIYNFFNWPHIPHSRLIVIAIANTMDLPERELSGKIRSRLGQSPFALRLPDADLCTGSNRIKFKPYNWKQLEEILAARLEGLEVFDKAALMMAAKKVAGVSGDARRALDICRCVLLRSPNDSRSDNLVVAVAQRRRSIKSTPLSSHRANRRGCVRSRTFSRRTTR